MCKTFQDIAEKIGAEPDAPLRYRQYIIDVGFMDVKETILRIPTSPWPRNPRLKKVGGLELMNVVEGAQGFLLGGFTKEFGRSKEELEILLFQMRKELTSQKLHSYVSL
jgi:hypothetical protein